MVFLSIRSFILMSYIHLKNACFQLANFSVSVLLGHENIRGVVFMCASALFEHELLRPYFSRKC